MKSISSFLYALCAQQNLAMPTITRQLVSGRLMSQLANHNNLANGFKCVSSVTQLPRDKNFNDIVSRLQQDLRNTEMSLLVHFNREQKRQTSIEDVPSTYAATIFSTHMEVLCTPMGAKPCVLFFIAREGRDYKRFYNELIEKVHSPWFIKGHLF
jgi:hypothetical protein